MTRLLKKWISFLTALVLLAAGGMPAVAIEDPESGESYIVKLVEARPMLRSLGSEETDVDAGDSLQAIPYADGFYIADSLEDVQALLDAGLVEYVEPNDTIYLLGDDGGSALTDPLITQEWYLDTLGMETAWDAGLDGTGVKVAVVDSGLWSTHEDFVGLTLDSNSKSFIAGDDSITDTTGHGTFVSGILSAQRNNAMGLAGLVDRSNLLVLRCFAGTTTDTATIVSALSYAVAQGANVINMSFGGASESLAASLRDVLSDAAEQGILLVAAAGNDGTAGYQYPAALDSVVGVGMVDREGAVADRSQKNDSVFVAAPGYGIPGVGYSGDSDYISSSSGTSYAAPMVSALAVMVKQVNKSIDSVGFQTLLKLCAVDRGDEGYDTSYGWGMVSAAALATALFADYSIAYECGGGSISQSDYPTAYTIGRTEAATLPTGITRSGWTFTGWYTDAACTGQTVTTVPAGAVGNQTYYAGWVENTDISLRSVAVQGVATEADALVETLYSVILPSNSAAVKAEDFAVTPVNESAIVSEAVKTADSDTWTFSVSLAEQSETYTVSVTKGTVARPEVVEGIKTGSATPASADEVTDCLAYEVSDVSVWFSETDASTAYTLDTQAGAGKAVLDGTKLTYTPAATDAGSTIILHLRAQNEAFVSTGTADVSVAVDAVPVSDSTVTPSGVAYDISSPTTKSVTLGMYGNSLLSVSENGNTLSEGTDYTMGELPAVSPDSGELTLTLSFLNTLSVGSHTLQFVFSSGRTEAAKTISLILSVTRTYDVTFQDGAVIYATRSGVTDGVTVTLPANPTKSGYAFSGWHTGENGTGTAFNASTAVTGSLTVYANWAQSDGGIGAGGGGLGGGQGSASQAQKEEVTPLPLVWSNPYQDVAETDWYYDAVAFVCDRSLFQGVSDGSFAPQDTMTRGMLVTVLYRLAEKPEFESSGLFTGTEEHAYYAQAMDWAVGQSIIHGYGHGVLGPNDPVSREQLATILFQYAALQGYETEHGELSGFPDAEQVSVYAKTAMGWANASGIISGTADQQLMPREQASRAEVAQMLMNFCRNFGGSS